MNIIVIWKVASLVILSVLLFCGCSSAGVIKREVSVCLRMWLLLRIGVIAEQSFWLSKGHFIFCGSCHVGIFTVYLVVLKAKLY